MKNDLFEAQDQGAIENILEKHSENFDEDSFSLEDKLPLIDECFKVSRVKMVGLCTLMCLLKSILL